jgi:amidase
MTANVEDNALLLDVVAGQDGIDSRQSASPQGNYQETMREDPQGLKVGVVEESFGTPESEPEVDSKAMAAAEHLSKLGMRVEQISVPIHAMGRSIWTPTLVQGSMDIMLWGHGSTTNHAALYMSGASDALSRWHNRPDEISIPLKVLMLVAEFVSRAYGLHFYGKSQNLMRRMREEYNEALECYDLLLMPTTPQAPTRLPPEGATIEEVWGSALNMNRNTSPFCGTGHPALTLPCGFIRGLPIGFMLVGRHWDEGTIYRAAYAYEQSTDWRNQ